MNAENAGPWDASRVQTVPPPPDFEHLVLVYLKRIAFHVQLWSVIGMILIALGFLSGVYMGIL
jgi:hypothetical protein